MTKRKTLSWAIVMGCATLCPSAPVSRAQDPIRVQSTLVLVPTVVLDNQRIPS